MAFTILDYIDDDETGDTLKEATVSGSDSCDGQARAADANNTLLLGDDTAPIHTRSNVMLKTEHS